MSGLRVEVELKNEMLNSGVIYCLVKDIMTREIDYSFDPMLPTDALQLGDYQKDIERKFGTPDSSFTHEVILAGIARFKSCRRQGRDYWGRSGADPMDLW